MLKSMTGFGRCEMATDEYKISVEMKAVNHRYLDLDVYKRQVLEAGADVIVAGSAVFKGNPAGNVKTFLNIFQEFE